MIVAPAASSFLRGPLYISPPRADEMRACFTALLKRQSGGSRERRRLFSN